jgi:hypothetical protein
MKTIIAGSRTIKDYLIIEHAIKESGFKITEVVSGCAPGVDRLGEKWAEKHGVPIKRFPADWDSFGRAAGAIRNGQMAEYAGALIAIWDGISSGTEDMIKKAQKRGIKGFVYNLKAYYDKEATEKENARLEAKAIQRLEESEIDDNL